MKVKINIVIEDDTTEEQFLAAGGSMDEVRDIYRAAFHNLLEAAAQPGSRYDLRVEVEPK